LSAKATFFQQEIFYPETITSIFQQSFSFILSFTPACIAESEGVGLVLLGY
jgi:hypothetical protein